MFRHVGFCVPLLLGLLLLVSCQPLSDYAQLLKKSLFAEGCTAPCWAGIQSGVTNVEDVKKILIGKYGEERVIIQKNSVNLSMDKVGLLKTGTFSVVDGVVQESYLSLNEVIKVNDLVTIFGTPTYVLVDGVRDCLGTSLWFKDYGVFVYLDSPDKSFKGVDKTQSTVLLRLTAVGAIDEDQIYDVTLVEWDGYKDYCEIVFGD
jgi:hypothetical protein